jgi:GT2 family glycosyltransferase
MSDRSIPGVTAVVCNFNGEAYLPECLRSVLDQEGVDEVLVVDDASTDGSVALVRERFPEVGLIELAVNGGPCVARNAGMRAARHRWVLAVDNDAVLTPEVLPRLRAALEKRPDACVAQVRSVLHDEPERVHYDGGAFHYVGLIALRNFYRPLAEAEGEGVLDADALIGICALMDRDVVLAAGGYDEDFFYLAEDYELSYRLRVTGHRLLSVEDALVLHRGGTAGLSFRGGDYPARRARLRARNRWRLIAKCYAGRTLLAILPGLFLYELVGFAFALRSGNLVPHLAGTRDFLRELPGVLTSRAAVQRLRSVPDRTLLVGGPLTLSPALVASGPARAAAALVDLCLRSWWRIARPFSG